MDFDFEAHERKLNDQRVAEENARIAEAAKLHGVAQNLLNDIVQYAGSRSTLSNANIEKNLIKIFYYDRKMHIECIADEKYNVSVHYSQSDFHTFDLGSTHDRNEMMTAVVNFVAGQG